jgi:rRNA biogenesis protein RRP5
VDVENRKVEMSFRSEHLTSTTKLLTLADLHDGEKVDGRVKKVEDYGLFIEIEGSKVSGLCHKSQV